MTERFNKLTRRMVALGPIPTFSASELHEIHDGIISLKSMVNNLRAGVEVEIVRPNGTTTLEITVTNSQASEFMTGGE